MIGSLRYRQVYVCENNRLDGIPVRVPGPQDEEVLEPYVHQLYLWNGDCARSEQPGPVVKEDTVSEVVEMLWACGRFTLLPLQIPSNPQNHWRTLLPQHLQEVVCYRQEALLRQPINRSLLCEI